MSTSFIENLRTLPNYGGAPDAPFSVGPGDRWGGGPESLRKGIRAAIKLSREQHLQRVQDERYREQYLANAAAKRQVRARG
jgi:hypothetical protein